MKFFIDADSCAKPAREYIEKLCLSRKIHLELVANREIPHTKSDLIKMVICNQTKNAADDYIVENSNELDMAITRDLELAERLISKNVCTVNDKGKIFTKSLLEYMLKERELSLQMKALGISTGGKWNSYSTKECEAFIKTVSEIMGKKNIS